MSSPWQWSNEHNQHFAITADGMLTKHHLETCAQSNTHRFLHLVKKSDPYHRTSSDLARESEYEKLQQANAELEETTHFRHESDFNSLNPTFFQHPSPFRNPHPQLVGHARNGHHRAREPFVRSDSAPAAQTTDTYTPKEIPERYAWDVVIPWVDAHKKNEVKYAVALLDTQSQNGNWITQELLKNINKAQFVHKKEGVEVETAIGLMRSIGTITIEMRRREGNKFFKVDFNVGPSQKDQSYEMLLGRDFLNKNDIIRVNRDALLPNLTAGGLTPGKLRFDHSMCKKAYLLFSVEQQAAMAALEERRRLEREKLAANGR